MASKRKRRRKKTGFTIHTRSDRAPHHGFQLELERSKPSYQRQLELERALRSARQPQIMHRTYFRLPL
jgi:hypothetical protein